MVARVWRWVAWPSRTLARHLPSPDCRLPRGTEAKGFRAPAAPKSLFSCVAKRKVTKRERHPAWRLPPIGQWLLHCLNSGILAVAMGGKSVRRGRAFRRRLRVLAKRSRPPVDSPAGLSSPPHRRTGAPGRAARHRASAPALPQLGHPCPRHGAHSVRHRCAAAKAWEPRAKSPATSGTIQACGRLGLARRCRSSVSRYDRARQVHRSPKPILSRAAQIEDRAFCRQWRGNAFGSFSDRVGGRGIADTAAQATHARCAPLRLAMTALDGG